MRLIRGLALAILVVGCTAPTALPPAPTATLPGAASPTPSTPTATPRAGPPSCGDDQIGAEDVVRMFFSLAEHGDVDSMRLCWTPEAQSKPGFNGLLGAWGRTRGAIDLDIAIEPPVIVDRIAVRVRGTLRVPGDLGWAAGQTRWFHLEPRADVWRIASIATAYSRPSDDDVWAEVRGRVSPDVAVLWPSWLPSGFAPRAPLLEGAQPTGAFWFAAVGYTARDGRVLLFFLGGGNSAPPKTTEEVLVREVRGSLQTTESWPGMALTWTERGQPYQIQASHATREEMMRIAANLIPLLPLSGLGRCDPRAPSDPAQTGVEGFVYWGIRPMPSLRVEARDAAAPVLGDVRGAAVTDADGHYRISGLPPSDGLTVISVPASAPYLEGRGPAISICANAVTFARPVQLRRPVTGLSIKNGDIVPAGRLALKWDEVPEADRYCVAVWDVAEGNRSETRCAGLNAYVEVFAPSFLTPALVAGGTYTVAVLAYGEGVIAESPPTGLSFSAR
jgi:hypothetical protein